MDHDGNVNQARKAMEQFLIRKWTKRVEMQRKLRQERKLSESAGAAPANCLNFTQLIAAEPCDIPTPPPTPLPPSPGFSSENPDKIPDNVEVEEGENTPPAPPTPPPPSPPDTINQDLASTSSLPALL